MKFFHIRFSILLNKLLLIIILCCISTILYLLIRIFITDQFLIPTCSMAPTLVPGDRVLVNKFIMGARLYTDFNFQENGQELKSMRLTGLRKLKHNDIVVFNYPKVGERIAFKINYVYCKRCIAIPGDTLYIKNGYYICNNYDGVLGLQKKQDSLATVSDTAYDTLNMSIYPFNKRIGWTFKNMGPLYIPREGDVITLTAKEGVIYKSLLEYETGKVVTVDWKEDYTLLNKVPLKKYIWRYNYYFMAGDNVFNSMDSRYWGLVPENYIIGVVKIISYSRNKKTNKIDWKRVCLPR